MNPNRKRAKDYIMSLGTKAEVKALLDSLCVSDEASKVAYLIVCEGWSHTQIAIKYSMSVERSKQLFAKCLDKIHF